MTIPVLTERRILLVEDDEALRVALARGLRVHGYAVTEAFDGQEAVRQVLGHDCDYFDAVVCDYSLGSGLTGGEAVNLIREHCPDQPVLFLSGHDLPADLRDHEAFLQKPAMPEQIAAEVQRLVSKRITLVPREP